MPDDPRPRPPGSADLRVCDADRERVTRTLAEAAGEGRLTVDEADERQAAAYAARFYHELDALTADLPQPAPSPPQLTPGGRKRLAVHAILVAALAAMLVTRWVASGDGYFWPIWPMFWMALSLVVHYRRARRGGRRRWDEPIRPPRTARGMG